MFGSQTTTLKVINLKIDGYKKNLRNVLQVLITLCYSLCHCEIVNNFWIVFWNRRFHIFIFRSHNRSDLKQQKRKQFVIVSNVSDHEWKTSRGDVNKCQPARRRKIFSWQTFKGLQKRNTGTLLFFREHKYDKYPFIMILAYSLKHGYECAKCVSQSFIRPLCLR